jgi:hypothetical protein
MIAAMGKGLRMRVKISVQSLISYKSNILHLPYYIPVDVSYANY